MLGCQQWRKCWSVSLNVALPKSIRWPQVDGPSIRSGTLVHFSQPLSAPKRLSLIIYRIPARRAVMGVTRTGINHTPLQKLPSLPPGSYARVIGYCLPAEKARVKV